MKKQLHHEFKKYIINEATEKEMIEFIKLMRERKKILDLDEVIKEKQKLLDKVKYL